MKVKEIEEKVERLLEPILVRLGLELYDVEWLSSGRYNYLRVFIDKKGGVTIKDCEKVSKELGAILDREDFIEVSYYLEVSSPGLTRELKKPKHFKKSIGALVRIYVKQDDEKRKEVVGRIVSADDLGVEVLLDTGDKDWVPYDLVWKAKLVYEERK